MPTFTESRTLGLKLKVHFVRTLLRPHQSAVLHVLLQPLHGFPAHTFTFGTGDSAFGHNLELPTLLLAPWWMPRNKAVILI